MNRHLEFENNFAEAPVKLLVSFSNVAELAAADGVHLDVFDLKNPAAGPLGRPRLQVAKSFLETLNSRWAGKGQHPIKEPIGDCVSPSSYCFEKCSIALGEYADFSSDIVNEAGGFRKDWLAILRQFNFVKVGLSQMQGSQHFRRLTESLGCLQEQLGPRTQLVPVAYADHSLALSPSLTQVMEIAVELKAHWNQLRNRANATSDFGGTPISKSSAEPSVCEESALTIESPCTEFTILLDTYTKPTEDDENLQKTGLLNFTSTKELGRFTSKCIDQSLVPVVAGSIQRSDLPILFDCGVRFVGIRGAVCCYFDRGRSVDARRLRDFCLAVKQKWTE